MLHLCLSVFFVRQVLLYFFLSRNIMYVYDLNGLLDTIFFFPRHTHRGQLNKMVLSIFRMICILD